MDLTVFFSGAGDVVALGAGITAALAAWQSHKSAGEANAAAGALAKIESDRRHAELTPRFRVRCEPLPPSSDKLRVRVMLTGPTGLDRIDGLTVTIRNDHFGRGKYTQTAGGPTPDEIEAQIWGPFRFLAGAVPDVAREDNVGRSIEYHAVLPIGEEIPYLLERTTPPSWATDMSQETWEKLRGPVIRFGLDAWHKEYGKWILPCEIDLGVDRDPYYAGWLVDVPQQ